MLRTFDRDEIHKVIVDGAIVSVKMFTHTQEVNYSRFNLAPYLSGATATVDKAMALTQDAAVAWVSDADMDQFILMIAGCVVGFSGIEGITKAMEPIDVLKSLPFTFVQKLGRKIEALSVLDEAEASDSGGSSGSEKPSAKKVATTARDATKKT